MNAFSKHRIALITGKGGVGKTTLTAAVGRALAASGRKVLVTEPAYSETDELPLARLLGLEPNPKGYVPVTDRLTYTPLRARTGHETFLRTVIPTPRLIRAALRSRAVARFLIAAPSLHEMGLFYHILTLLQREESEGVPAFDSILVDMPATGHALALTQLPEILLRLIPSGPIARALREGQEIINDPERGTAWVVSLPMQLPVTESLELIEGLKESQMHCSGVILNMMPRDVFDPNEREILARWCTDHGWIGSHILARSADATASVERLRQSLDRPVLSVPRVRNVGDVDAIVRDMVDGA